MANIWVIGSANVDYVLGADHIAAPGETVIAHSFQKFTGGKGFNQACTARQIIPETQFIAVIGKDSDGDRIVEKLARLNFKKKFLTHQTKSPTGAAYIQVDHNGENSIVVHSGANFELNLQTVSAFENQFKPGDYAVLQGELKSENQLEIIDWLKLKNVKIILNQAPFFPMDKKFYSGLNTLIVNETECNAILDQFNLTSDDSLPGFLNINQVVKTLGKKGAVILSFNDPVSISVPKTKAIDTTGAGDAFVGAYAAFLFMGKTVTDAVKSATKIATFSVTIPGAQPTFPKSLIESLK